MKTHKYFIFMAGRTVLTQLQQQRHSDFLTILQFRQFRLLLNLLLLVKWPNRLRQTLEGLVGFGWILVIPVEEFGIDINHG